MLKNLLLLIHISGEQHLFLSLSVVYWNARLSLNPPPWQSTPNFSTFFNRSGFKFSWNENSYHFTSDAAGKHCWIGFLFSLAVEWKSMMVTLVTKMLQQMFSLSLSIWVERSWAVSRTVWEVWEGSTCWPATSDAALEELCSCLKYS